MLLGIIAKRPKRTHNGRSGMPPAFDMRPP